MRILLAGMAWMFFAAAPGLAQSLPAPTFADVPVARIDDLGQPFDLKANVYLPAGAAGTTPLVLYIHGKGGAYGDPRDQVVRRILGALLPRGIAVARIDYRRSGRMPAMLMDTKAYLRFFRAHAGDYHIDPDRIGIWGVSRGGNLAALLAVTGDVRRLEGDVGGNVSQSSRVDASVVESPLTDMFLSSDDKAASMFGDYLGTNDADSKAIVAAYRKHDTASPWWRDVMRIEQVNPLNYVNKDSPPALIICGGLDPANVVLNCTAFFDRYIKEAAPASYYALSTGTHVRVGSDIEAASVNWLAERLSRTPPPLFPDPEPGQR
ncbi:MAG TPA: alpha/beta hydrolase [Rhizomicrobium sp.]|jgi:acetyl esterase/lipase|nr:alpha/beta hydrolase [Rhizomicrobium sp.]